jgi:hypothetical protein
MIWILLVLVLVSLVLSVRNRQDITELANHNLELETELTDLTAKLFVGNKPTAIPFNETVTSLAERAKLAREEGAQNA